MSQWEGPPTGHTFTSETRVRRRKTARIWVGILLGVLAGNLVAAGTYLALRGSAKEPPVADRPSGLSRGATVPAPAPLPVEDVGAIGRAHRVAGLAALERQRYDEAIAAFEKALASPQPPPDVAQLIEIARELKDAAQAPAIEPIRTAPPRPAPARAVTRRRPRPAPKPAAPAPEPEPAPVEPVFEASPPEPEPEPIATPSSEDELPLCPEGYTPPTPSTPYAVLPRKCRPR